MFRICHILSNIDRINFGIWNAALFGTDYLNKLDFVTEAWVCQAPVPLPETFPSIHVEFIGAKGDHKTVEQTLVKRDLSASSCIIVTHGTWLAPTRVGNFLQSKGFKWIYTPHGMLEPWSMGQGALKKRMYFSLFEGRYAKSATRIRAVSSIEQSNLQKSFNRSVVLIENGVKMPVAESKLTDIITFLFLGRLHHKKGVELLVKGWKKVLSNKPDFRLIIAGPDEGELPKIQDDINGNISYEGPVYGQRKAELLCAASYFVLPSFSEGFPTSVVEAMSYGAIPVISSGCNVNEVFSEKLGYRMEPDMQSIESTLEQLSTTSFDINLSERNREYASQKFSEDAIGARFHQLYLDVLKTPISK